MRHFLRNFYLLNFPISSIHTYTHTHIHTHTYIFISELSILFHWSICLFLCQHHPVLITVTLRYSLKSENIMASTLVLVFFWLGGVWLLLQSLFFVETSSSSFYNSVMVDFISKNLRKFYQNRWSNEQKYNLQSGGRYLKRAQHWSILFLGSISKTISPHSNIIILFFE